ncbi:unnamed protein product [Microthlaspi erraticum]|uniref:Uncharacterized protein n=1 Tax=Microthlaspi erraticum TaxID=1685480 RepID=A0A6D2I1P5_9BRAS|nr:unnamed protein product [Microthlaspi erraticum]
MKGNEEIKKIIKQAWEENPRDTVEQCITKCRKGISKWNREHHVNSKKNIEELKLQLEQAMSDRTINEVNLQNLNAELNASYKAEEAYWKQRSRQLWLTLGDKNT